LRECDSVMRFAAAMSLREELLAFVPDAPTSLEVRALLRDPRTIAVGDRVNAVIVSERELQLGIIGAPDRALLARVWPEETKGWEVLTLSTRAAPELPWECAIIFEHVDDDRLAEAIEAARGQVTELEASELAALPESLAGELAEVLDGGTVLCARCEGLAASFAYASSRTEGLFDVSIDTLERYRRRGLARIAAAGLIEVERRLGRRPVWGAVEENVASLRLAEGLGFERVGELFWARL
jgi:GNAT superfamily N-acetyltransferase